MTKKHYDVQDYNFEKIGELAKIINEKKQYDIVINIYEKNGNVINDFKKLKKLKSVKKGH